RGAPAGSTSCARFSPESPRRGHNRRPRFSPPVNAGGRKSMGLFTRIAAWLQLVVACAAFSIAGCLDPPPTHHPTDAALVDNFAAHRAEFETLLAMFDADRELGRVGDGFTRPDDPSTVGVSAERIATYHRLFDALGLRDGIEGYDRK